MFGKVPRSSKEPIVTKFYELERSRGGDLPPAASSSPIRWSLLFRQVVSGGMEKLWKIRLFRSNERLLTGLVVSGVVALFVSFGLVLEPEIGTAGALASTGGLAVLTGISGLYISHLAIEKRFRHS